MKWLKPDTLQEYLFPGSPALDPVGKALLRAAGAAVDRLVVARASGWVEFIDSLPRHVRSRCVFADHGPDFVSRVVGLAASGVRVAGFSSAHDADRFVRSVSDRPVPLAAVVHGEGVGPVPRSGFAFVMLPATPQEGVDFGLVAHRLTEASLVPGVCIHDAGASIADLATYVEPEPELLKVWLPPATDAMESATAAQEMLFGASRPRVPALIDLDRPTGVGPFMPAKWKRLAEAGTRRFFLDPLPELLDRAFEEFGSLTGRFHSSLATGPDNRPESVIVTFGPTVALERARSGAGSRQARREGIVRIAVVAPFPASQLELALRTATAVTILERAGATGGVLVERVKGCLTPADTSGRKPDSPAQRVFQASLSSGATLSSREARALYRNMSGEPSTAEEFEVGVQFASPEARTPSLQSLHQSLRRSFPEVETFGLPPDRPVTIDRAEPSMLLAASDRTVATRLSEALARAFYAGLKRPAATARLDCPTPGGAAVVSVGAVSPVEAEVNPIRVIFATGLDLVTDVLDQVSVDRGVAVVTSGRAIQRTPDRLLERLIGQGLDVFTVEVASTLPEPVEMAGLAAAWLSRQEQFSDSSQKLLSGLLTTLSDGMGWSQEEQALAANLVAAPPTLVRLQRDEKSAPAPEPPAPRKVREAVERPGDLADVGRWWRTVGYSLGNDEFDMLSPDPYLSSGVLPARSAVIEIRSAVAEALPQVAPENCTGCNACAAFCPEAAVRSAAKSVQELIDYGVERVSKLGKPTIQLERASRALAKQAHRTISRDELRQFRTVGEVLNLALEPVLEAMKPAEDAKQELLDGFEALIDCIGILPVIRTERFFDEPENQQKGSGMLFFLAVHPDACTSCGICVAACGDDALDMRRTKADLAEAHESASTTVEELQSPWVARDDSDVMRFVMGRRAADAVSPSVSDSGGSGLKMAVRLICSLIEDEWSPRYAQLALESRQLADEIRTRITETLHASVEVNDFEMFRRRLDSLPSTSLSGTELFGLIDEISGQSIDTSLLSQLTSSLGDLEALWTRLETGRTGEGRARMAAVFGAGAQLLADRAFPHNPYPFPWIHVRQGSPVSVAEGLIAGLVREMADSFSVLRNARRLAAGLGPDPVTGALGWDQLTGDERMVCPPICVFTQEDSDLGDSWLDSGFPIKLFVLDGLDGFAEGRLEDRLRPLYRPHSFVLHSTPASFEHFVSGIREGLSYPGTALFRIYAPVPDVHGFPVSQTLERMSAAVATRSFPLLKYAPGSDKEWQDRWSLEGNEKPGDDWVSESRLPIAWMAGESRFRGLFDPSSPDEVVREVPLLELLENGDDEDAEARVTAVLAVEDRSLKVGLRPAAVDATRQALGFWRLLQELAGVRSTALDQARREARRELEQQLAESRFQIEAEARDEIRLIEKRHQAIYHEKLKNRLLQLSGYTPGSEQYEKRLTESATGEE